MNYKDAVGADINIGDHIVYSATDGRLQLGKVLELTTVKFGYLGVAPALKIQGARKEYWSATSPDKFKKMKRSVIYKLENVLVINNNLNAIVTLI